MFPSIFSDTTNLQSARAVFFENHVFLSCSLAIGPATGCTFLLVDNFGNRTIFLSRFTVGQRQCFFNARQRDDIRGIFVRASPDPSHSQVEVVVVESEEVFTNTTLCSIHEGKIN